MIFCSFEIDRILNHSIIKSEKNFSLFLCNRRQRKGLKCDVSMNLWPWNKEPIKISRRKMFEKCFFLVFCWLCSYSKLCLVGFQRWPYAFASSWNRDTNNGCVHSNCYFVPFLTNFRLFVFDLVEKTIKKAKKKTHRLQFARRKTPTSNGRLIFGWKKQLHLQHHCSWRKVSWKSILFRRSNWVEIWMMCKIKHREHCKSIYR